MRGIMLIWRTTKMSGLELNMNNVRKAIEDGWISCSKHPELPLYIYNYTRKCQLGWHWTPETIVCRGLILDDKDNVVARPFPKFFTVDQLKDLRNNVHHLFGLRYKEIYKGPFTVTEKVDGSMGILYQWDGKLAIASRGSFTSEQALHGTELIQKYKNFDFAPNATYIFEIVYPTNRVVVDYGDRDELVLLAVSDNETGKDLDEAIYDWQDAGGASRQFYFFNALDQLLVNQDDNKEGYVVRFENGMRVKVKFDEYLRLHRLLTNVSARNIWWMLREGHSIKEYLLDTPDEFHTWVRKVESDLNSQYNAIHGHVEGVLKKEIVNRKVPLTRKQLAEKYSEYRFKGIMFQMLDNKEFSQSIWRLIKPNAEKPFSMGSNK